MLALVQVFSCVVGACVGINRAAGSSCMGACGRHAVVSPMGVTDVCLREVKYGVCWQNGPAGSGCPCQR